MLYPSIKVISAVRYDHHEIEISKRIELNKSVGQRILLTSAIHKTKVPTSDCSTQA